MSDMGGPLPPPHARWFRIKLWEGSCYAEAAAALGWEVMSHSSLEKGK